jgi:putative redox protein
MEGTRVEVSLQGEGYRAVGWARTHELVLDEPVSAGGGDEGPTPVEALLAALGACTAMTLRMYALRKGWPLRQIRVALTHQQMRREDCVDCPPEADLPRVDRIQREIGVVGELSPEQLERLHEIAERCPVHRILAQHPTVVTTLHREG